MLRSYGRIRSECKGIFKVRSSAEPVERGLGPGIYHPPEQWPNVRVGPCGTRKALGDEPALIVTPGALPCRMKGHRHQSRPPDPSEEAWTRAHDLLDVPEHVAPRVVLQLMHQGAHRSLGHNEYTSRFVLCAPARAMGTESLGFGLEERMPATVAARIVHHLDAVRARAADMPQGTAFRSSAASHAGGRVSEVGQPTQQTLKAGLQSVSR